MEAAGICPGIPDPGHSEAVNTGQNITVYRKSKLTISARYSKKKEEKFVFVIVQNVITSSALLSLSAFENKTSSKSEISITEYKLQKIISDRYNKTYYIFIKLSAHSKVIRRLNTNKKQINNKNVEMSIKNSMFHFKSQREGGK